MVIYIYRRKTVFLYANVTVIIILIWCSTQIDPLYVLKDWHLQEIAANKGSIHDFILDNKDLLKVNFGTRFTEGFYYKLPKHSWSDHLELM